MVSEPISDCSNCESELVEVESSTEMEQTNVRCSDCDNWISGSFCEEDMIEAWNLLQSLSSNGGSDGE